MSGVDLSFVIPALNEEDNIEALLESIERHTPPELSREILVVDHGSTDRTVARAEPRATVHVHPVGTIATLRNFGANQARGDVLIFLDCDVRLTATWSENLSAAIEALRKIDKRITGSWYGVDEGDFWLLRRWFEPQTRIDNTHINSGHLILLRENFLALGGFDERLETGEDYELSMRAEASGLEMFLDDSLPVVHVGYPTTFGDFFSRELWHGKSDMLTLSQFLSSKVAMVGTLVVALTVALLLGLLLGAGLVAGASAVALIAICLGASIAKYGQEPLGTQLGNAGVYWLYFIARGLSWLPLPSRHGARRDESDERTHA